ncbi:MAG TPA: hypothetical protein VG452_10490 [Egibacteraceae bacterium]|nr:hypothetical protein [Egibacteraceae bacterium]
MLHPYNRLLRVPRSEGGEVIVRLELHPRFDYGLTVPRLELDDDHLGLVFGGADALVGHRCRSNRRTLRLSRRDPLARRG